MAESSSVQGISEDTVVVASQTQLSTALQGEAVILNAQTGTYHGMEAVAAHIWKLLQNPTTVHEIHGVLLDKYDVDATTCRQHLYQFLEHLATEGLIEVRSASEA